MKNYCQCNPKYTRMYTWKQDKRKTTTTKKYTNKLIMFWHYIERWKNFLKMIKAKAPVDFTMSLQLPFYFNRSSYQYTERGNARRKCYWKRNKFYLWPADEGRRAKPDDRRWRVIIDLDRRRYHSYTTDNIRDTARYFFFLSMKCIVLTDTSVSPHMNILTTTMNKILTLDKNFRSFIKKHSYLFNTSPFKD